MLLKELPEWTLNQCASMHDVSQSTLRRHCKAHETALQDESSTTPKLVSIQTDPKSSSQELDFHGQARFADDNSSSLADDGEHSACKRDAASSIPSITDLSHQLRVRVMARRSNLNWTDHVPVAVAVSLLVVFYWTRSLNGQLLDSFVELLNFPDRICKNRPGPGEQCSNRYCKREHNGGSSIEALMQYFGATTDTLGVCMYMITSKKMRLF